MANWHLLINMRVFYWGYRTRSKFKVSHMIIYMLLYFQLLCFLPLPPQKILFIFPFLWTRFTFCLRYNRKTNIITYFISARVPSSACKKISRSQKYFLAPLIVGEITDLESTSLWVPSEGISY